MRYFWGLSDLFEIIPAINSKVIFNAFLATADEWKGNHIRIENFESGLSLYFNIIHPISQERLNQLCRQEIKGFLQNLDSKVSNWFITLIWWHEFQL